MFLIFTILKNKIFKFGEVKKFYVAAKCLQALL